jgi:hypothetical protein
MRAGGTPGSGIEVAVLLSAAGGEAVKFLEELELSDAAAAARMGKEFNGDLPAVVGWGAVVSDDGAAADVAALADEADRLGGHRDGASLDAVTSGCGGTGDDVVAASVLGVCS